MPLPDGLYKLALQTPEGTEYGVAVLQDGRLRGGDSGMVYVGTYAQDGELFSADVRVSQHHYVPGAVSALGLNDVMVQLHGLLDERSVIRLRGTSPETDRIRFAARLSMIAD